MLEDVLAGIFMLIAVFTLVGNSLTIAAIHQNPKLNTASNHFIFGLAIADLLVIFILSILFICVFYCVKKYEFFSSMQFLFIHFVEQNSKINNETVSRLDLEFLTLLFST
jgi:hypothetical protein